MKIPKIKMTFDHYFKTAIVLCAVAFIYSNWNTGRYQPYPVKDNSVLVSILDTKSGVFYYVSVSDKSPSLEKIDVINLDQQIKSSRKK